MCWSYFEGAASSLGNLRRGCRLHFLPVSPSLLSLPHTIHSLEEAKTCVLATSRYFRKHTVTQPVYKDLHGYSRWLVFGLFFLSFFLFFFFKAAQTTQHYGGNRSSPSLTFSTTVSPSFLSANSSRLPRYQDSPETACPGSCQILCARMSVGPSEVPAASESSISTRNMEKRREADNVPQHPNQP